MDQLANTVQERHGVAIHDAIHQYHLHPQLGEEAVERLKELRAQVEKMGEVNVTAIEEHQEIATRFEFLSKQKKDLEASLAQLTEAIKTIDETSRQRFKETFDIVNDKFQQVFPRLFGGGRASLLMTNEPGSSEPGIEILAQPPGKKLQSVNLFSGGEKALTAVALIFGIFLIKPTPFCLLDEVDAPLDEGNVGRYNDMVEEMSKTSQFILITHNKRTMEIGDTLYGVTMEEPGRTGDSKRETELGREYLVVKSGTCSAGAWAQFSPLSRKVEPRAERYPNVVGLAGRLRACWWGRGLMLITRHGRPLDAGGRA